MLLGYAIALGVIASVFLWQSSMQLWVPLAMGQNNDLTSASCHVQSTLLVCHDRFESDCQVKVDVRTILFPAPRPRSQIVAVVFVCFC